MAAITAVDLLLAKAQRLEAKYGVKSGAAIRI